MTDHKDLSNSELHEQKNVSTAADNTLYWADGQGSGNWKPLIETAGSWTYSSNVSEVEFTDLEQFIFLQIDLVGITVSGTSDQYILAQLGNDAGYTTSSIYYSNYWASGVNDCEVLAGINTGYLRNNAPYNSMINFSSTFLTNFNKTNVTIANSQESMEDSTATQNAHVNRLHWVRESKAYNKIKLFPTVDDFSGGTIVVSGYRWFQE